MSAKEKLTPKAIENAKLRPDGRERLLGDGGGLHVRLRPTGTGNPGVSRVFTFLYRSPVERDPSGKRGKLRRLTIGEFPNPWTLKRARQRARRLRLLVDSGRDPSLRRAAEGVEQMARVERAQFELAQERERQRRERADALARERERAERDAAELTVEGVFDRWRKTALTPRTTPDGRRRGRKDGGVFVTSTFAANVFPVVGHRKARTLMKADIRAVLDPMIDRGATVLAGHVLADLRQMLDWAARVGHIDANPAAGLTKDDLGLLARKRERNLTWTDSRRPDQPGELEELAAKLPGSGLPTRIQAALKLILATGVRREELTNAQWSQFDLQSRVWTIPKENKSKRAYRIPLSEFALSQVNTIRAEILRTAVSSDWLLPGDDPKKPIREASFTKMIRDRQRGEGAKRKARSKHHSALVLAGGPWTAHDLRRTCASRLNDLGVAPHIIERVLNHAEPGLVQTYQRGSYEPEIGVALGRLGDRLSRIFDGEAPTNNVVQLHGTNAA